MEEGIEFLQKEAIQITDKWEYVNWDCHFKIYPGATEPINYHFIIRTRTDLFSALEPNFKDAVTKAVEKYKESKSN
jgi:hypothetical protein